MAEHQQAFITGLEKGFGILEYVKQMSTLDKLLLGVCVWNFLVPVTGTNTDISALKAQKSWPKKKKRKEFYVGWFSFKSNW